MPETNKLEDLTDNVKQYLLLNIAIFKLESTKQASTIGASIVSALVVGMAAFLVVFTVGIGLGFYFSALLGDTYSGFAIMAGFYLIVAIVIYVGRKKIIEKPIRNKIIEKILQNPKP